MNYPDVLESYLIPAEEGFLFTEITEENISKLGEKKALIVFTTDNTIPFGGINIKKYLKQYKFSKVTELQLDKYIKYRIFKDNDNKFKCPKINPELNTLLDDPKNVTCNDDKTIGDIIYAILSTCDIYSRSTNTLIVLTLSDTDKFSYSCMREYPILITRASAVKSVMNMIYNKDSISIKQLKYYYKDFIRLDRKIPKSSFVKDMKFDLFHVSPNSDIKELIPRITTKPLRNENAAIYRVSAAPSIDACFRAVGIGAVEREKDKKKKYYVYKLRLSKDLRIVKPPKELLPDQEYTNEYWILDPVPVDLIGTIIVSVDEKNNKLLFDTSSMEEDPMITTSYKLMKK